MMNARAAWHPTSAYAMGKKNNTNAAVDIKVRVVSISGQRVADASIFPFCPPGHPQSFVYARGDEIFADDMAK